MACKCEVTRKIVIDICTLIGLHKNKPTQVAVNYFAGNFSNN